MNLPRLTDPAQISRYADGSKFLLRYGRNGYDMKMLSLQWNVARTKRFFFIDGNGVLLPVDDFTVEKLQEESLYLLYGMVSVGDEKKPS
jgi:hypothetical protein